MEGRVFVFDTTLRDGEQSPGCRMDSATKLALAEQLARLGVDVIEAGFPISSPGDLEAVSRIAQAIRGPRICALARTRKEDIVAAARSLENGDRPRIHTFVATSDVHMESKLRKSPQQIIDMACEHIALARSYVNDVQFSPEDAARTGIDFLTRIVSLAIDAGATTINIPDTVGYAVGNEFGNIIRQITAMIEQKGSNAIIAVHCHNDLGLAVANTLAGVMAGARQVECCVTGIGERAGNAQLEAVVMALRTRQDVFNIEIGINTARLYETARMVSSAIGKQIPDNLPIVGGNAFAHGAGIHFDGVKKNAATYEIMKPENVGWKGEAAPLVKHSGRAALKTRLEALGYDTQTELLQKLYDKFCALADSKTLVYNDDLHLLVQECFVEGMQESEKLLRLIRVDYHKVGDSRSATITLGQNGSLFEASGTGDGAVSSVGNAILKALDRQCILPKDSVRVKDFHISKSAGGIEAVGLVNFVLENDNGLGYGRGSDTDVIVASAKAMISAINHILQVPVRDDNDE